MSSVFLFRKYWRKIRADVLLFCVDVVLYSKSVYIFLKLKIYPKLGPSKGLLCIYLRFVNGVVL